MQQVNLYLPELRPQREWLTARNAVLASLIFVAVIAAIQVVWGLRAANLRADVEQQREALATLEAQVDKLRATVPAGNHKSVDETIAQLQTAIANRQKVGRIIRGQNVGNARGFYRAVQSVARESNAEFSLERFTFSRGGTYVEMQGKTRTAQAVPLYLQRLKSDPVFQDARFGLLSLSSERDSGQALEFSLGYDNLYLQRSAGSRQ